jgi:antitoxin ParD1/3/4
MMPTDEKRAIIPADKRALQNRAASVKDWLVSEVVPVYDAMHANPGRGRSAERVAQRIRAHHARRLAKI